MLPLLEAPLQYVSGSCKLPCGRRAVICWANCGSLGLLLVRKDELLEMELWGVPGAAVGAVVAPVALVVAGDPPAVAATVAACVAALLT